MTEKMIANKDGTQLINISEIAKIETRQIRTQYHVFITRKNNETFLFQVFDLFDLLKNKENAIFFMRKIEEEIKKAQEEKKEQEAEWINNYDDTEEIKVNHISRLIINKGNSRYEVVAELLNGNIAFLESFPINQGTEKEKVDVFTVFKEFWKTHSL